MSSLHPQHTPPLMKDETNFISDAHFHTSTITQGNKLPNHAQVAVGAGPHKPKVKLAFIPSTYIHSVKACQKQHPLNNRNEPF